MMDAEFCIQALEEALTRFGRPEIFNIDKGSQSTSPRFVDILKDTGARVSADGQGARRIRHIRLMPAGSPGPRARRRLRIRQGVPNFGSSLNEIQRCHSQPGMHISGVPPTPALSVVFRADFNVLLPPAY